MEGVRREHLGSAYMEEPGRSHMDGAEEMEVAAVGVPGGRTMGTSVNLAAGVHSL